MITVWPLQGIPEVRAGDDLVELVLAAAGGSLQDGDILVVTSKIVSKAEGRIVAAVDREDAITSETVRVVATRPRADGTSTRIVENRLGIVGAAAGVDASNVAEGTILLLPIDPDASARSLAEGIRRHGPTVGVLLSDTLGRPWRDGQTDIAIGAAGVRVFDDIRGTTDTAGKQLVVTLPCLADELCAAADLVKGKTSGCPVAVVRGRPDVVGPLDLPGARSIVRSSDDDLFRLGSAEAEAEGYARGFAAGRAAAGS
ncbi:coenzyme F420-0:L-glutamate ligase [Microbacterium esteraromaticum]|uniref:Coenzyme F420-0:L-glutamate ligase n=1 Tax=Microbacterium esteraromaticum TaxID=57043 RepID=A0A7D7W433_9MICO|nr:coenzyme F420-0:L-glutamate ligase [Microbacterium esteraromaticum]QMU95916.1 coenzyme F420-0:L-glutamate ligase [Microbacterium esteraromaticum]